MKTQPSTTETAGKIDVTALNKAEYVAPKKPVLLSTKPATYLSISGVGAPGSELFGTHVGALYSLAFTVKMTRKAQGLGDYTVGKLEARWPGVGASLTSDDWRWEILMRTPDFVTEADLRTAAEKLVAKGQPALVHEVKLVAIDEGECVQMLHVGSYATESRTFEAMLALAASKGLSPSGPHHEIYLSDPRRVPEDELRTILRIPVSKKA